MGCCYSTILFDFDGTLTPSLPLWVRAFQFAFDQFGISLTADQVISTCFYRAWEDIVAQFEVPSVANFARFVHTGLDDAFVGADLFAGVRSFLDECISCRISLGIVTSTRKELVTGFVAKQGIAEYFKTIVAAEDILKFKPDPEPVLLALDHLNSIPQETILIGDSHADMAAASAAGIHKGLFLPEEHSCFYNFDELRQHQPEIVFQEYSQLWIRLMDKQAAATDR